MGSNINKRHLHKQGPQREPNSAYPAHSSVVCCSSNGHVRDLSDAEATVALNTGLVTLDVVEKEDVMNLKVESEQDGDGLRDFGDKYSGQGVDKGDHVNTFASTKTIDRRQSGVASASSSSMEATLVSYEQNARASRLSPQVHRAFRFNPAAAEFVPSSASSIIPTTAVSAIGLVTSTEENCYDISLNPDKPTLSITTSRPLLSVGVGVTPNRVEHSGIPTPASHPQGFALRANEGTTEVNLNQKLRGLASAAYMRKAEPRGQVGPIANTIGPATYGTTDILGNSVMDDIANEAVQDDDLVIRVKNRKHKSKELARDPVTNQNSAPLRHGDPRLWPEYKAKKQSNHTIWNKERPGKDYTREFIKNTHYLNHLSNAIASHPTGHPSSAKIETDTMYGFYGEQHVSVVVERKSPGDRIATTSLVVHQSGGSPPARSLPRNVNPAHVGQEMTKNGGLMRSVWKGQGLAMAGVMGRKSWADEWKRVGERRSWEDEGGREDGGVAIVERLGGGQGGRGRGHGEYSSGEDWGNNTWADENLGEDESMDDEQHAQNKQWKRNGEEDDDEDDDESADERNTRLDKVIASMGLIELRRMAQAPFDMGCDAGLGMVVVENVGGGENGGEGEGDYFARTVEIESGVNVEFGKNY